MTTLSSKSHHLRCITAKALKSEFQTLAYFAREAESAGEGEIEHFSFFDAIVVPIRGSKSVDVNNNASREKSFHSESYSYEEVNEEDLTVESLELGDEVSGQSYDYDDFDDDNENNESSYPEDSDTYTKKRHSEKTRKDHQSRESVEAYDDMKEVDVEKSEANDQYEENSQPSSKSTTSAEAPIPIRSSSFSQKTKTQCVTASAEKDPSKKQRLKSVVEDYSNLEPSVIFLIDEQEHLYRLKFFAIDPIFSGVHLKPRISVCSEFDKFTQTFSIDTYPLKLNQVVGFGRFLGYVKRDFLTNEKASKAHKKKKFEQERPYLKKVPLSSGKKGKRRICARQNTASSCHSVVHIATPQMTLKLKPTAQFVIEHIKANYRGMAATAVVSSSDLANKANFHVLYKHDILTITIRVKEPELERIIPLVSQGCQPAEDDKLYFKHHMLGGSYVYLGIPMTVYYNTDRNIIEKIKRENFRAAMSQNDPIWKQKIIKAEEGKRKKLKAKELEKHANATGKTSLTVEIGFLSFRASSKVMSMVIEEGEECYREWAALQQYESFSRQKEQMCKSCLCLMDEELKTGIAKPSGVAVNRPSSIGAVKPASSYMYKYSTHGCDASLINSDKSIKSGEKRHALLTQTTVMVPTWSNERQSR